HAAAPQHAQDLVAGDGVQGRHGGDGDGPGGGQGAEGVVAAGRLGGRQGVEGVVAAARRRRARGRRQGPVHRFVPGNAFGPEINLPPRIPRRSITRSSHSTCQTTEAYPGKFGYGTPPPILAFTISLL